MSGLFVTGTDTGVGKTLASAALLHALRARGTDAAGMKPLASGCEQTAEGWRNEDALALVAASAPRPSYADVNPYALPLPLAPEIAACRAGVEVRLEVLEAAYERLHNQSKIVVVEGVGGWLAPLSASLDQIDLVRLLRLPVVLVVGMRLGCINHARLTARAIAADGARLVGWIASHVDPEMQCQDENFDILRQRLDAPCWGRLPHMPGADPLLLAQYLAIPEPGQ
jgi:dethiobiotin synthetase